MAELAALVEEGRLRPVVEQEFPLPDVARAFERNKEGHTRGKLVVVLD